MTPVASTDEITVALHELTGRAAETTTGAAETATDATATDARAATTTTAEAGATTDITTAAGAKPTVLIAHATGFHAHAYLPVAEALAPRLHSFGVDLRGHGDSPVAPGWDVDWTRYGDDALAVARHLAAEPGGAGGLIGFGHSMGGAALLMAAATAPELFRALVLFEPIVVPTDHDPAERPQSPLPAGSRRRRPTFPSFEAAIANFASKPPMDSFAPAALEAYVRHGFRELPGEDGIWLKCDREHEARTFEQGGNHRTWDLLPGLDVATTIVAGRLEEHQPSLLAEPIAERLPRGHFVCLAELDHFGPMTHPRTVADLIAAAADADSRSEH